MNEMINFIFGSLGSDARAITALTRKVRVQSIKISNLKSVVAGLAVITFVAGYKMAENENKINKLSQKVEELQTKGE